MQPQGEIKIDPSEVFAFKRWLISKGWVDKHDKEKYWELVCMKRVTSCGTAQWCWIYCTGLPGAVPVFDMAAVMVTKFRREVNARATSTAGREKRNGPRGSADPDGRGDGARSG
jgi:hypothetical protein